MESMTWTLRDAWTVACREFNQRKHQPGELAGMLVFPAILVVVFGYVFGSAISTPGGGNYREYLMPGLFAMTALMGIMANAVPVAKDAAQGVMDRFRSMPMARSAVPLGRAVSELTVAAVGLAIMAALGLLVGWRAHHGLVPALGAFGLVLLLRFALSWVGISIGLSITPEAADAWVPASLPVMMLSNSFVPTDGMPAWLRLIADYNPVSALVAACRELFGNPSLADPNAVWPLQHPVLATLAWSVVLLAVFVPLATLRYQRR
jgi:ABC-2 type transport system permease protein